MPLKNVVNGMIKLRKLLKEDVWKFNGRTSGFSWSPVTRDGSRKLYFLYFGDFPMGSENKEKLLKELKKDAFIDKNDCVDSGIKSLLKSSSSSTYFPGSPTVVPVFRLYNPIDFKNTITKDFWGL